jgi:hypothetical protein
LSNYHTQDHDGNVSSNGSSFANRRELRANNTTGALPALGSFSIERLQTSSFDFNHMLESLHDLFEHDRQAASLPDSTRCGICYLHFPIAELHYRDEGFYACAACAHALGHQRVSMLRKQQRFS